MEKEILTVHYNEIALKGKLRSKFESMLCDNILKSTGHKASKLDSRLFLSDWDEKTRSSLKLTPGVSWFGDGLVFQRDFEALKTRLAELFSNMDKTQINLDVKRIDKKFPETSLEIKEKLMKEFKIRPNPGGKRVLIEIMPDSFIINTNIERGIGGVPIGSAGKVISLFSGGIDSAVVPFEMMKRGCNVDLLHVYALPTREAVMKTKIIELATRISSVSKTKLFLVPFHFFGIKAMEIDSRYELVLFKRFLLKLAERLAKEYEYKGICTGDALSQVASQTLDNINAISYGLDLPIFRPLLTYNKEEIIDKAKAYGTYDTSIKEYKDCCSIVSKNPATAASRQKVEKLEMDMNLEKLVNDSLSEMRAVDIP